MKVDGLEEYILAILLVKPGFILCCFARIIVPEYRGVRRLFELLWSLHAFDNFLSTIAMMHINIHNGDPFDLITIGIFHI